MDTGISRHERAHPTPAKYTAIALILAAVTVAEVGLVYMGLATVFLVPALLILSATKFSMVAMFYMHLRFDHRLFSALFVGGILLTSSILVALLALFGTLAS